MVPLHEFLNRTVRRSRHLVAAISTTPSAVSVSSPTMTVIVIVSKSMTSSFSASGRTASTLNLDDGLGAW